MSEDADALRVQVVQLQAQVVQLQGQVAQLRANEASWLAEREHLVSKVRQHELMSATRFLASPVASHSGLLEEAPANEAVARVSRAASKPTRPVPMRGGVRERTHSLVDVDEEPQRSAASVDDTMSPSKSRREGPTSPRHGGPSDDGLSPVRSRRDGQPSPRPVPPVPVPPLVLTASASGSNSASSQSSPRLGSSPSVTAASAVPPTLAVVGLPATSPRPGGSQSGPPSPRPVPVSSPPPVRAISQSATVARSELTTSSGRTRAVPVLTQSADRPLETRKNQSGNLPVATAPPPVPPRVDRPFEDDDEDSAVLSTRDSAPPPPLPPPPPAMSVKIGEVAMVNDGSLKKVQLFVMEVFSEEDQWLVCRRYNAFHALWQELQHNTSKVLTFPPKKIKLSLDVAEIERRKHLLQKFLDEILAMPHLCGSMEFIRFIDPLEKPSMFGLSLLDVQVESALWQKVELPFNQSEWVHRYVVLVSGRLFWFRNANSVDPIGELKLDYCVADVEDDPSVADGQIVYVFTVKHLLADALTFAAVSVTERKNWITGIRHARSVISGGTIGATADQFALDSDGASRAAEEDAPETRGAQVLKGYATGRMRLSTFNNVPDTVSSVMGSLSFGDADVPDQIVFKAATDEMRSPGPERAEREPRFVPLTAPTALPSGTATTVTLPRGSNVSQPLSRSSNAPIVPPRPIQGATFRKLVEKLTHPDYHTATFAVHFLLTYRVSQTPQELLALLLARYHHADTMSTRKGNRAAVLARNPVQDRVCLVLETWLDVCFSEFVNDTDLTTRLLAFVFRDLEGNILMNNYALQIKEKINEKIVRGGGGGGGTGAGAGMGAATRTPSMAGLRPVPQPLLPKLLTTNIDVMDLEPLEIARQMTILDHDVFCRIQPPELLGQKWAKNRIDAPNVTAMITRFNMVAAWVTRLVLSYPDAPLRAVVFARLVSVGQFLYALNSFGSACALIGGLMSPSVNRLKHTKELLSEETSLALTELERLIETDKNHQFYRRRLECATPPCVPYLGLYLADLTFVEDGNPSFLSSDEAEGAERVINWEKRRMLGKILQDVRKFQSTPYALAPVPALQSFLATTAGASPLSDREAYDVSLKLEPRE